MRTRRAPSLRAVPLIHPTPLYAWSLLWRAGHGHPGLNDLAAACAAQAAAAGGRSYDPARDWLPGPPAN